MSKSNRGQSSVGRTGLELQGSVYGACTKPRFGQTSLPQASLKSEFYQNDAYISSLNGGFKVPRLCRP